jgi:hypothetical protein
MLNKTLRFGFASLSMASALGLFMTPAWAESKMPTQEELWALVQTQQRQLNEMQAMLKKTQTQAQQAEATAQEAKSSPDFLDTVKIGGVLEFEATESGTFAGADSSDLSLAKAEIYLDAKPDDYVQTHVQLIYEDGADTIKLDEATVAIGNTDEFPLYGQVGRWAVPFGNFDTAMSTDPITKTLGETKENAVMVGVTQSGFSLEAYTFNGDTQKSGEGNQIDQYGLSASYEGDIDGLAVNLGAGYLNNIADSDGLNGVITGPTALNKYVGGMSLNGGVSISGVSFNAGYMKAMDKFQSTELAFKGNGAQPRAWNTELSYTTQIMDKDTTFAATYQGSDEALALSLPEQRLGAAVTVGIYKNTALTVEYLKDKDYTVSEGGTGKNAHKATAKLAVEF